MITITKAKPKEYQLKSLHVPKIFKTFTCFFCGLSLLSLTACQGPIKTYQNQTLGFSFQYPDANYTVDNKQGKIIFGNQKIKIQEVIISQPYPGNRLFFYVTGDKIVLDYLQQDNTFKQKSIAGKTFKEFHRSGEGAGYGYLMAKNGKYYVFESAAGPTNAVFETIMTTVEIP